ncbi:MAG: hypothetical protein IJI14_10110 [Anaerolineaceae bacterium]|nr:hypothetical protein [Anaerolineaceae bacterium]
MNKTHKIILPIIAVFFGLFFGWSTSSAETIEKLTEQLLQVESLPSGTVFQLVLTDDDATSAAKESLVRYMDDIQMLIQQSAGINLDVSDPQIEFDENFLIVSIRAGFGAFKVNISASGTVLWDKEASAIKVDIKSVDIPVISVDPSTVNSYIEGPINEFVQDLMRGYEIRSFEIKDDYAVVEAMKK